MHIKKHMRTTIYICICISLCVCVYVYVYHVHAHAFHYIRVRVFSLANTMRNVGYLYTSISKLQHICLR